MKKLIAILLVLVMSFVICSLVIVDIQKLHTENVNLPKEEKKQGMTLIEPQVLTDTQYEKTLEVTPENGSILQLHLYCYGNYEKYAEAPADFMCYKDNKLIIKKTFYSGTEKFYHFKIDRPKSYNFKLVSPYGDKFSMLITAKQFNE